MLKQFIANSIKSIPGYFSYLRDKQEYKNQEKNCSTPFKLDINNDFRCLTDRYENAGSIDGHYFLQDIFMANKIFGSKPEMHYDVGSRIDGFISHLISMNIPVTMIDVRPLHVEIKGLDFLQGNATQMDVLLDNSIKSLSSLHAVEHFGLGRYGDPVDVDGWKKALHEFQRVLEPKGKLYLSVPIGPEDKLMFNAHRIFHPRTIVSELADMKCISFTYIKDFKIYEANVNDYIEKTDYLCGLFIFEKY